MSSHRLAVGNVVVVLLVLQFLGSPFCLDYYSVPGVLTAVCLLPDSPLDTTSSSPPQLMPKTHPTLTNSPPSVGHDAQLHAQHALECYRQGNESSDFPNGHCVMIGAYDEFSPSLLNLFEELRADPVVDGLHHLKSLQTFLIQIKTKWNHTNNNDKQQQILKQLQRTDTFPQSENINNVVVDDGIAVVVNEVAAAGGVYSRFVEVDPIVLDIYRVVGIILSNPLVVAFDNDSGQASL
eukprot:GHVS01005381.1.p1 GENE.GHVS01005381.1~~GHVS01005381.1.p1  ORF type:complete len:237 (+),score=58.32 GHVS01005381.1:83-793(+)